MNNNINENKNKITSLENKEEIEEKDKKDKN